MDEAAFEAFDVLVRQSIWHTTELKRVRGGVKRCCRHDYQPVPAGSDGNWLTGEDGVPRWNRAEERPCTRERLITVAVPESKSIVEVWR